MGGEGCASLNISFVLRFSDVLYSFLGPLSIIKVVDISLAFSDIEVKFMGYNFSDHSGGKTRSGRLIKISFR